MAISVIAGISIGNRFSNRNYIADHDRKINAILNLVADDYVDTLKISDLIETSIPAILEGLDPHTVYIPKSDLKGVNEELDGKFSGIGISFMIMNDTIHVIEVLPGGPAEKAGMLAGDRIVTIDDSLFTGKKAAEKEVFSHLRGIKDSNVKLGIKRPYHPKRLSFTVTRGDIQVNSVDASYIIEKNIGYIKVNKFGRNTYDEFLNGLIKLKADGAKQFIVDLRGNAGGFLEMAILMANEFLPENELIVYTKGRYKRDDMQMWSDGNGSFQNEEIVVLIDENTASSSEIFAGAIQDNDRGLIVGCRSFGKGLVQKQFNLPDSSAIRMTTARYYTPSGRSIQKDYRDKNHNYNHEVYERYLSGELYSRDSMKVDTTQVFSTAHLRKVYGGGGIAPDIFVPRDTSGITNYYTNVASANLMQRFAYTYIDKNRRALQKVKDYQQLLRTLPSNDVLLNDFVTFAAKNGVPARWYYIHISKNLILNDIKALMARDMFGSEAFYPIYNRGDKTIEAAIKAIVKHKATFPILPD